MRVYRISRPEYVATALLGNGAALAPGRWNSRGVRLAYTASSVSLAMLEILVHVNREDVPEGRRMLAYEIPDAALAELPTAFREVVVLREIEGLGYREIAEITGTVVGTVMSRLSRGRHLLRQSLARKIGKDRTHAL